MTTRIPIDTTSFLFKQLNEWCRMKVKAALHARKTVEWEYTDEWTQVLINGECLRGSRVLDREVPYYGTISKW